MRPLPHKMKFFTITRERRENAAFHFEEVYLYRKLEPLLKSSVFCVDLGSSGSLKKAWYSTQVFQKDLHTSRLAMENSSVSLQEG